MKRMMLFLVLMLTLSLPGCGGSTPASEAEAARNALGSMLRLAEAGDWEGYVDGYYGEADKFGSPGDRDALVARFRDTWSKKLVPALREASTLDPVIEDGRAVFGPGDEPVFVLYRDAKGAWGFHL